MLWKLLINNLSPNLRITYTRFRSMNFSKLPVFSGSNLDISLANRLRDKCDSDSIGDEFHFVLECSFFTDKKISFIKKYFHNNPSSIKFCQLFNSSGRELINLCHFLYYIIFLNIYEIIFLILYKSFLFLMHMFMFILCSNFVVCFFFSCNNWYYCAVLKFMLVLMFGTFDK